MDIILLSADDCYDRVKKLIGLGPGCYVLRLLKEDGAPHPIPRFLGEDAEGRLYIGASSCLPARIAQLKISVAAPYGWDGYKGKSHGAGLKLARLEPFIRQHPFERLGVTVEAAPDPLALEGRLLNDYFSSFGEHPPLND